MRVPGKGQDGPRGRDLVKVNDRREARSYRIQPFNERLGGFFFFYPVFLLRKSLPIREVIYGGNGSEGRLAHGKAGINTSVINESKGPFVEAGALEGSD